MISCKNMLPCQSREAFVTVTSYRGGIMDGYLRHPRLEGKAVKIQSLAQLILTLDALVEKLMTGEDAFKGKDPIGAFCGIFDTHI